MRNVRMGVRRHVDRVRLVRLVRAQTGAALLTAVLVVLAVTMVALGVARIAFDAERGARAERDRALAFAAAEAGLADAERDIEGGADPASLRASMFHDDSALGFVPGCGRDVTNLGLCAYSQGGPPVWQVVDVTASAPYGSYTGALLPAQSALPVLPGLPVFPYGGP
jgi:Tfp pilus assembly protein PilX